MTDVDHVSQQSLPPHGPDGTHEWLVRVNDLGDFYEVCLGCGKQSHWEPYLMALGRPAQAASLAGEVTGGVPVKR